MLWDILRHIFGNSIFGSDPLTMLAMGEMLEREEMRRQQEQFEAEMRRLEEEAKRWRYEQDYIPLPEDEEGQP